jgi:hypothetical protein
VQGNTERDRGSFLNIVSVVFVLVATFPGSYQALRAGLDPSWQFALNSLALSEHVFGRDVVFPFGPLGYLLIPLDFCSNLTDAIALWLVIHTLFALGIFLAVRRGAGIEQVAAFAITYVLANALSLIYEYHLLAVIGLWLAVSLSAQSKLSAALPAAVAGMMAGFFLLAKLNLGLSAIAMLGLAELLRCILPGPRRYVVTLIALAAFVGTSLTLTALYFGSLANLSDWLRGSLELASGFGAAMSLRGPSTSLLCGGAALVVFLTATLASSRRESLVARVGLLFFIPVLLSFRHGFVRHDVHVRNFFPFALAALAIQLLFCRGRRETAASVVGVVLVAALTLPSYSMVGLLDLSQMAQVFSGLRGAGNIRAMVQLEQTREALDIESRAKLASKQLPISWLDVMRDSDGSVDVFPWELSYAPANDLPWDPNPLLQTYAAFTADLDQKSAQHYADPDAPDFVILEFKSLDRRHPLLDAPATTREMFRRYAFVDEQMSRGRILLRQVESRFTIAPSPVERVSASVGEWIQVPSSDTLLFAELDIKPTWRGRISQALFAIPPMKIQIEYADGARRTYRLISATARNGLLMNFLPRSLAETALLFRGMALSEVVRFRIGGAGASHVQSEFDVTWNESDFEVSGQRAN